MNEDRRPRDPVTENIDILKGKPAKAFVFQDHQAHIQVHMAAMQDPKIQSVVGQDPQSAQTMMAAMHAHINEHVGYEYKKQIEASIGMEIPDFEDDNDQEIPKEMENRIAQMAAQASQQLLQQHQQEAQQQQAQQQMQDPIIQMQMQELQIKQAEVQRKIAKDQLDAAAKDKQMQIEMERINAQKEIAGANMAMKHSSDKQRNDSQMEMEGFRQGMELNRQKMQQASISKSQDNKPPQKGKNK
jgi:hypothetical protein